MVTRALFSKTFFIRTLAGWLNNKSRMSREAHVRFCEQLKGGGSFRLTRPCAESFFGSLKVEHVYDFDYTTREEAKQSILSILNCITTRGADILL
jgi:hypothetical protein